MYAGLVHVHLYSHSTTAERIGGGVELQTEGTRPPYIDVGLNRIDSRLGQWFIQKLPRDEENWGSALARFARQGFAPAPI